MDHIIWYSYFFVLVMIRFVLVFFMNISRWRNLIFIVPVLFMCKKSILRPYLSWWCPIWSKIQLNKYHYLTVKLTIAQLDKFVESVFRVDISQSSNRIFGHGKKISGFEITNGVSKFDCCMVRNPCEFGNNEPLQIFQLKTNELWLNTKELIPSALR